MATLKNTQAISQGSAEASRCQIWDTGPAGYQNVGCNKERKVPNWNSQVVDRRFKSRCSLTIFSRFLQQMTLFRENVGAIDCILVLLAFVVNEPKL